MVWVVLGFIYVFCFIITLKHTWTQIGEIKNDSRK